MVPVTFALVFLRARCRVVRNHVLIDGVRENNAQHFSRRLAASGAFAFAAMTSLICSRRSSLIGLKPCSLRLRSRVRQTARARSRAAKALAPGDDAQGARALHPPLHPDRSQRLIAHDFVTRLLTIADEMIA